MVEFTYVYDVGEYRGRPYRVGVRADPSLDAVESFAVILFFERGDGSRVEVAKIDDSEHEAGGIHFDRYYRDDGADRKDFDVEVDSVFEADDHLESNWRRYAKIYQENHGTRNVA